MSAVAIGTEVLDRAARNSVRQGTSECSRRAAVL